MCVRQRERELKSRMLNEDDVTSLRVVVFRLKLTDSVVSHDCY